MALRKGMNKQTTRLQAASALAMAMFEQKGLTELIDSKFKHDSRIRLTPGNAVKAMIGTMLSAEGRRPLFGISNFYLSSPTEQLFGSDADVSALNARAFSRNLDRLFKMDLGELTFECYSMLCKEYGLSSNMFNIDETNFSVTSLVKEPDVMEAAFPERCGHAKDGHNERLVYSLLSVTDGNGAICYERPYDGATTDGEMDRDAIEFLSKKVDPDITTLAADCKIVTGPLVKLMLEKGFGFVAKCPDNFGKKVRSKIVESVRTGTMDPSLVRDGWELYDTDAEVEGKMLRFVAFRTTDDISAGIEYLRDQGLKEAGSRFGRFESRTYNCDVDARRALDEALYCHVDSAYDVIWSIDEVEVSVGYGHRGRPRKDEKPITKTEYKVNVELVFNEERAKALSQDRGVRVLITNLPRSNADEENIRFGATADTVLMTYLGQYRVEHAFRLMKDGMGIDRVYLHRPSRENAMMFVISLGTMLSDIITHVLKSNGIDMTMQSISGTMSTLDIVQDAEGEYLDGPEGHIDLFLRILEVLEIDPDHLLG